MRPMTDAVPFTKKRLAALSAPQGKSRVFYRDTTTAGLSLCVTSTGAKAYYFVKWTKGRPVMLKLGEFPGMSVGRAAEKARELMGQIDRGIDPAIARQAVRHEQTIGGLWQFWLEHAKEHKKSWREDERMYRLYLSPLAKRQLSTIRKADLQSLLHRIAEGMKPIDETKSGKTSKKKRGGKYMANRVHELIRAMFHKAVDIGYQGDNPALGIKRFPEEKRDRFLHGDELPAFFRSLMEEPNELLRDFFLVTLLTGARRSNVQSMAWEDIDLVARYWRIPETKSGLPVVVPLVPAAVAILEARCKTANVSRWVFPGRGRTGHLVEPKLAWARIIKRAGLSDVRIHDLRRSLGSWQAMGGASLPIIGKSLGHRRSVTTEIYARLQLDPVRNSVESATTAILAAGNLTIDLGGVKLLDHEQPAEE